MKQQVKHWWSIGLVYLLLLALIPSLLAQEPTPAPGLTVADEDNPLIIHGRLDGQTSSFSGNVRLTLVGGDTEELYLLASDLKHNNHSDWDIDRSNITIPNGVNLHVRQPTDVRVTINNALHPGIYTGDLQFLLLGQEQSDALVIPMELHLNAVPQVMPIAPALSWQVVRCDSWLDCQLATWFLPESALQDNWQVWLDNQTIQTVAVVDGIAVLPGISSGIAPMPDQVTPQTPATLPANQTSTIIVTIQRQQLAPDSYQGTLRFTLAGTNETVSIPTTLAVRQGPLWALIVVLVGILLGRLVRDMETPTAQAQVKLMPEYWRLRAAADDLKESEAREDALAQLQTFKQRLNKGKETLELLEPALEAIEARITLYATLETLAGSLDSLSYQLKEQLAPQFAAARKAVRDGRQDDAQKQYEAIKQAIEEKVQDGFLRDGKQRETSEMLQKKLSALQESIRRMKTAVSTQTTSGWVRLLAWLSGIRLDADVRFWIVRPILSLTLLVILVIWGMYELYVTAGTTFGAAGIYDYTGLLLWGLTADVVSRTLSNFPAKLG